MKTANILSPLTDLRFAIVHAFSPTLKNLWETPSLLFYPQRLSRIFMNHVWISFGNGVDEGGKEVKDALITPHATGVVLDIGAGHGHTMKYLDKSKVTTYIALEPNELMHPYIRKNASACGFTEEDGTLLILSCGAEDTPTVLSALPDQVDTIISILTLCTVPSPQSTLSALISDVLKPRTGLFLYYEHVLSHKQDVAWWQKVWAPIWQVAFDGCRLDRPSHLWVDELVKGGEGIDSEEGAWRERVVWGKPGEDEENLFWHRVGRYVKA